jgi:TPR repeat protein
VRWYRLAAAQGLASAQFNLGFTYDQGLGVVQNSTEAVRWYRLAAEQENADAQYNLGVLYSDEKSGILDFKKAHMWLNLAAVKGDSDSVKVRDTIAQRMTAQQIGEAQTMARQCMERKFKGCD